MKEIVELFMIIIFPTLFYSFGRKTIISMEIFDKYYYLSPYKYYIDLFLFAIIAVILGIYYKVTKRNLLNVFFPLCLLFVVYMIIIYYSKRLAIL